MTNGGSHSHAAELVAEVQRLREERDLRQFFNTLDQLMEGNASQQKKAFDMLKRREHTVSIQIDFDCLRWFSVA